MQCGLQWMVIDGIKGNMESGRYNFTCWNCKLRPESQQLGTDPDFARSIRGCKVPASFSDAAALTQLKQNPSTPAFFKPESVTTNFFWLNLILIYIIHLKCWI